MTFVIVQVDLIIAKHLLRFDQSKTRFEVRDTKAKTELTC
jgi:hypothetical protein